MINNNVTPPWNIHIKIAGEYKEISEIINTIMIPSLSRDLRYITPVYICDMLYEYFDTVLLLVIVGYVKASIILVLCCQ